MDRLEGQGVFGIPLVLVQSRRTAVLKDFQRNAVYCNGLVCLNSFIHTLSLA